MRKYPALFGALAALALLSPPALAQSPSGSTEPAALGTIDRPVRDFSLPDAMSSGNSPARLSLSSFRGKKAVVLMFITVGCPMTWDYSDRMKALIRDYASRDVAIIGVHSHPDETSAGIAEKVRANGWKIPVWDDRDKQEVAKYFGAVTTPTFFIVDKQGVLRYKGAYEKRGDAGTLYVRPALDAILSGKEAPVKRTSAFGCGLPKRGA